MKSFIILAVVCASTVTVLAGDYQIVVQEQIDGAEDYWHVDPILNSAGELEGFFSTSGQGHLFTFADGSTTFPEISAGRITANYMSENNDSLFLFSLEGNLLHLYTFVEGPTIVRDIAISLPSVGSWSGVMSINIFYDLAIEPDPRHSRYRVRVSTVDAYHNGIIIESAEYHWSAIHLVAQDLARIYTTIPAQFHCTGDFRVARGFASINYRYLSETHKIYHSDWTEWVYNQRTWSTVDMRDGNGALLHHQEHDYRLYRAMYGGNFCHHLSGDELITEYWNGTHMENRWFSADFQLQCLGYFDDSLQEVWSLPVGDLILQWADQSTGTLAGTGGRLPPVSYYGRYDSLVVFIDAGSGRVTDTVNLSRSVMPYKFFQTDGDVLNLLCRTHDTIFVYQFDTPLDVEEPVAEAARPAGFALHQNCPNPFNPRTEIRFSLPRGSHAKLEIYNIMGQRITTLVDKYLSPGEYSCTWDGSGVASGVYFYRLETPDFADTKKMVLMK